MADDIEIVSRPVQTPPEDKPVVVSRPTVSKIEIVSRPTAAAPGKRAAPVDDGIPAGGISKSDTPGFLSDMLHPNPTTHYGSLVPIARDAGGERRFGAPIIIQDAYKAFTAPGRAAKGEMTPEQMESEARNVAGFAVGTGAALPKVAPLAKAGAEAAVETGAKALSTVEKSRLGQATKELKDALSPTSAGPKAADYAGKAREVMGTEERDAARAVAAQDQFKPVVAAMDEPQLRELNGYIQGRSTGAARPEGPAGALADSLRDVFQTYRKKLEALPQTEGMGFQEDYLNQLWKKGADGKPLRDGAAAPEAEMPQGGGKQGSTGFTQAKTYDTLEDGIKAGLQPVTLDPIKLTAIYVNNAKKYISAARMLETAKDSGEFGMYQAGKAPEGWVKLNGRWTNQAARTLIETAPDADAVTTHLPGKDAYAPPEVARIYNNYIDKGMSGNNLYEMARATSRASVAMTLGVDVYHATAETMHAVAQTVSDAFRAAAMGEGKQAAKTLGKVTDIGPEMVNRGPGRKARDLYLRDLDDATPGDKRVVDLLAKANFGFNRGDQYSTYIRPELEKTFGQIWKDKPPGITGAGAALWETAKKGMSVANKPLFEHYIPNLRTAAAKREMANYLERHPEASEEELKGTARDISDAIDNRFGLMVHDNRFWNKYLSQVSQLTMLAPEWTIGKVKMASQGIKGLPEWITSMAKGEKKELPVATAQLLGLAVTTAFANSMLTYLHTGDAPTRPMDLVAGRTGGQTPKGDPERAILPGEQKDFLGYMNDPLQEFFNKINPVVRAGQESITNKDWRGDPVADPTKNILEQLPARVGHMGSAFAPGQITLQNVAGKQPGSNISTPERVAGVRPAPSRMTAPERNERIEDYIARKREAAKERHNKTSPSMLDLIQQMFQ